MYLIDPDRCLSDGQEESTAGRLVRRSPQGELAEQEEQQMGAGNARQRPTGVLSSRCLPI